MTLPTRKIGPFTVSAIGLGCMNLSHAYGVPSTAEEGAALLNRALDLGYDHLDTASIYGEGNNELLIAEALKGRRDEYFLASKCGIVVDGAKRGVDCSPAAITQAVKAYGRVAARQPAPRASAPNAIASATPDASIVTRRSPFQPQAGSASPPSAAPIRPSLR